MLMTMLEMKINTNDFSLIVSFLPNMSMKIIKNTHVRMKLYDYALPMF